MVCKYPTTWVRRCVAFDKLFAASSAVQAILNRSSMFDEQLARIPPEPPRPLSLLPGLRLRSIVPLGILWLPAFFLLFFATVPVLLALENRQSRLMLGRSQTVAGTVLETAGRDDQSGRTITYVFRPPGGPEFRGLQTVRRTSPYAKVRAGDSIPIRFLSSNPSVSAIDGAG